MTDVTSGVRLYGRVVSQTETTLVLEYVLDNASGVEIVVCNRLWRGRTPDGGYAVDPNMVFVDVEPGPRPVVGKRVPERGEGVAVEYPYQPAGTRLPPGGRIDEQVVLALPLVAGDVYHPPRVSPSAMPVASQGLGISIGWYPRADLEDVLIPDVTTTVGPAPVVKASPYGQNIARIDLDGSVPVIAPGPEVLPTRRCTTCGAVNAGDQANCLRCQAPLPAPAAPAGAAWQPTHQTPPAGLATYVTPGGQQGTPVAGGLPVQVVESYGDWAHIVAWTGWSGWVDGRLLTPYRG